MKRREFITLMGAAGAAAVWSFEAEARRSRRWRGAGGHGHVHGHLHGAAPAQQAGAPSHLDFNGFGPLDPSKLVTVAAVGDVLLHRHVQRWAATQKDGYAGLFRATRDLIGAADVAFANLEGPAAQGVASNGKSVPASKTLFDNRIFSGFPQFNYHPAITGALKDAGFHVLNTANNHALDRRQLGVDRTIEAIKDAKLAFTGSRHRDALSAPWHAVTPVTRGDNTYNIAWLGCSYGTNGIADRSSQILNCYTQKDDIRGMVQDLSKNPDIHAVILTPHWGIEDQHRPEARQSAWAKDMIEAGATAIIGQHPHVMQPIAKLTTSDGRDVPVAYSLGNFVSGQVGLARRSTAMLLLGLTPASNGKLTTAALGWIPLWMVTGGGYYAEPTARSRSAEAKVHQRHLAEYLVPGNMAAPTLPFWRATSTS